MWRYEKRLQFPVNIKEPNAKMAQFIMSQYGGPDGEMGASMRYLSQRYAMPYGMQKAVLTDIGTEASEMAHSQGKAFFGRFHSPLHTLCYRKLPFIRQHIQD